ncbi:MAG: hypothetical protein AAGF95_18055 [Chloroflexota bacterium]
MLILLCASSTISSRGPTLLETTAYAEEQLRKESAQTNPSNELRLIDITDVADQAEVRGELRIEALVSGINVERVDFDLQGPETLQRTEYHGPYGFIGDSSGRILPWNTNDYPEGEYTLTATVYNIVGDSDSRTETFTVDNGPLGDMTTDELNSLDQLYDHSELLTIASENAERFGGDTGRLVRQESTEAEWATWKLDGMHSFAAMVYYSPDEEISDLKFAASSDNKVYTPMTPITADMDGDWRQREYVIPVLPLGTNYVRVTFPTTPTLSSSPQIGEVHYSSISITDDFSTPDHIYDFSGGFGIATTWTEYFNGDQHRLYRTDTVDEDWVVWHINNMRSFAALIHHWPGEPIYDPVFYVSSDHQNYTEIAPDIEDLGGNWTRRVYKFEDLPIDTSYIKVLFPATGQRWAPQIGLVQYSDTVAVAIDHTEQIGTSDLLMGITHTRFSVDDPAADQEAIARAKTVLSETVHYQNQHIMGWGALNPNPAPGEYNWFSLDSRINVIREMNAEPVITLCCAPDWMKGGAPGETDWSKISRAPLPEHYDDYANLAAEVAQRYPDVEYFQVWNEFKGFWSVDTNNWDYVAYTEFYNKIYDAVKTVRPDAKIGGPYLIVEGTGSHKGGWASEEPIRARQWAVINYWLEHKHGADFISLDRGIIDNNRDRNSYSIEERMELTRFFGEIGRQLKEVTDLPIWWSELHTARQLPAGPALSASAFYHTLTGGSSVILSWNPMRTGESGGHPLFSDVRDEGGGQPEPHYHVFKMYHDHFGPGTPLYKTTSSSLDVEVLASDKVIMLINKRPHETSVNINGVHMTLDAYEVTLAE